MTVYREFTVRLSDEQKKKVASAVKAGSGVTIQVDPAEHGGDKLLVTTTQAQSIMKAKSEGKGLRLTLSKAQLAKQKGVVTGGFAWLVPLLAAGATAAAAELGKFAGQKAVQGVKKLTGAGGGATTRVRHSRPEGSRGSGLIAPGGQPRRPHVLSKKMSEGSGLIAPGGQPVHASRITVLK